MAEGIRSLHLFVPIEEEVAAKATELYQSSELFLRAFALRDGILMTGIIPCISTHSENSPMERGLVSNGKLARSLLAIDPLADSYARILTGF